MKEPRGDGGSLRNLGKAPITLGIASSEALITGFAGWVLLRDHLLGKVHDLAPLIFTSLVALCAALVYGRWVVTPTVRLVLRRVTIWSVLTHPPSMEEVRTVLWKNAKRIPTWGTITGIVASFGAAAAIAAWLQHGEHAIPWLDLAGTACKIASINLIFNLALLMRLHSIGDALHVALFRRRWDGPPWIICLKNWYAPEWATLSVVVWLVVYLSRANDAAGLSMENLGIIIATLLGALSLVANRLITVSFSEVTALEQFSSPFREMPFATGTMPAPIWWGYSPLAAVLDMKPVQVGVLREMFATTRAHAHFATHTLLGASEILRDIDQIVDDAHPDTRHDIRRQIERLEQKLRFLAAPSEQMEILGRLIQEARSTAVDHGRAPDEQTEVRAYTLQDIVVSVLNQYPEDQGCVVLRLGVGGHHAVLHPESVRYAIDAVIQNAFLATRHLRLPGQDANAVRITAQTTHEKSFLLGTMTFATLVIESRGVPMPDWIERRLFSPENSGYARTFEWRGRLIGSGMGLFFANLFSRLQGGSMTMTTRLHGEQDEGEVGTWGNVSVRMNFAVDGRTVGEHAA